MLFLEKMDKFVLNPNLPDNTETVLIGEKYVPALKGPLELLDVELIGVPANCRVDPRLSSHADLSVLHAGGENFFLAQRLNNTEFADKLIKKGCKICFCAENQAEKYPFDAMLNICSIGNAFIYCPKVSDETVVSYQTGQGRTGISSRQGYCKCSVCVLDQKAIISADKGISRACKSAGLMFWK